VIGHDRKPELARQCRDAVFETVASDLDVHDNRADFSSCKPFDHLVRALDEGIRISRPPWQDRHLGGWRPGHIPRELDINRQRTLARVSQDACDFVVRRRCIGQHRLIAGDLAINRHLGVHRTGLVVKNEAASSLARARRACDHNHGRAFSIGAGDGVDQIEGAGPKGDDGDTETTVIACRSIGCEANAGLVAQGIVGKDSAFLNDLEERQHEISWNPKNFASAVILQTLQQRCG
jgi:hypothetical protein